MGIVRKDVFLNSIKRIFIISNICFVFFCKIVDAQNLEKEDLIGIWQYGSSEISSGWFDNYQFFNNGSFTSSNNIFKPSFTSFRLGLKISTFL